ncbi:MAG TPA: SCO family protein [Actinomycetes bacterium]|nr:SCO family protein [Actinomycetes bacterium]
MRTLTSALALAAVLLTAACAGGGANGASGGAADVRTGGGSPWRGTALDHTHPLPDERFTDTEGKPFVPAEDADTPVTLVFFGYTYCPDVCNIVLANVASALRGASPDTRAKTQLLFVSTDPARDTPATVRDYLDRFDPAYAGLVAPVETVEQAASSLHISYERPDGTRGGDYLVQHGAYTTAFVNGKARVVWAEDTSVADLRADLERLARIA